MRSSQTRIIRGALAGETVTFKSDFFDARGGSYPLSHLYETFGLVRLTRLGHDVPWTKA
jgi:hypothetical protein